MIKRIRSNMSVNIIGGLVSLLLLFGVIVCVVGTNSFLRAFKNEYSTVTYHMADSITAFVNGDLIDEYLEDSSGEEYTRVKHILDTCCEKLNVSLIYVIKVDESDYGRFVSVFNSVNNSVDDSNYTEWEPGYERETTNEEYRWKYKAIYENEAPYETVFRLNPPGDQHPHITTIVPIKASSGNVTSLLCIQRPVREMTGAVKPYIFLILLSVAVLVVIMSVMIGAFLKRSIIRPVEKVSAEAMRFAKEHTKSRPIGDVGRYRTLIGLADSIDSMESDMVNYIDNLTAATAEREHLSAELNIAAKIQNDALPKEIPAFPDRNEFDIAGSMNPAKEVGGDFYNYILIDDDHLMMIIADVAGKGIPASLFMEMTNIMICDRTVMGGTPAQILEFVNENICKHNSADMFVTVWLGILEISTGRLISANAGHEYPAICRKGGSFEIIKDKHGFVIGGMDGMKFRDVELQLGRGDKLFVYTDGLPEAMDSEGSMYSLDRMIDALNEYRDAAPNDILEGVSRNVNEFVGDAEQFDDLTMLCLEYSGS